MSRLNINKRLSELLFVSLLFLFLGSLTYVYAGDKCKNCKDDYITTDKSMGAFTLSENGYSTPLLVSPDDFKGVRRVAAHLKSDICKVTDSEPELVVSNSVSGKQIILAGTIGKNPLIDKLIEEGKLDVSDVKGKWEVFVIDVIENPFPNVDKALVIAGSDKRGTIYGMYDVSDKIGVSPWYYWADVPPKKKVEIYVKDVRYVIEEPKVKYRGIFINDEAPALTGWCVEKFGGFNAKFYDHVFELILRMKGNFLWPAMWGKAFYDDDPENPRLADEYGVVVSTSHHEPMMRAHDEWRRYGSGDWNYETNETNLREFWREGIERMNGYESVVTLAMRGDGDEAMSPDANVSLLKKIVKDQREILADVTGKDVTSIPQVWALYKEVQEYYNKGMRVPDDVTLLLCDDNWGNIRKLPNLKDKPRSGGYGMYYHFDFVGGPRSYRWLNTNPISRIWEQMHLTYEYGVDRIWIVNVGDIKPMEFPIEFFLDYAWDPEKIQADDLFDYTVKWSCKQFGKKHAGKIANLITKYLKYNRRRKPELISPETYSLKDYREAEKVVSDYYDLLKRADKIANDLPKEYYAAFYELVLHPIQACSNLNDMYVTTAKNRLYARQGRVMTNQLADKVKSLFETDAEITDYYNNTLLDGKWSHMMDQTHIGYTSWNNPDNNIMPKVKTISNSEVAQMGVSVEGSYDWWPEAKADAALPVFDKYNKQNYYIEIFNRGETPFDFSISPKSDWIKVDKSSGKIDLQSRVFVSIDWQKIPEGKQNSELLISGTGEDVIVKLTVDNTTLSIPNNFKGFIESNNYISIEAEHFTEAVHGAGINWLVIPNLGRTLSGVTAMPVTKVVEYVSNDSPHLEYDVYFRSEGEATLNVYMSPLLNFGYTDGIRFAVSVDDGEPQVININEGENVPDWKYPMYFNMEVSNSIKIIKAKLNIKDTGVHSIKIWRIDPGVVIQKLVIETGEIGKSYLGPPESFNTVIKNNQ